MVKAIQPVHRVDAMRLRFAGEAEEGKRKNETARRLGRAPTKIACPQLVARGPGGADCDDACGGCNGYSWAWSDGRAPTPCPTSGAPCARPWCWACRNGNRPAEEIKRLRLIFTQARAAGKPIA